MSTVIKVGQAGPVLKRLSTVDLADHLAEAHAVIEEARRRAAQIVLQAKRETVQVREEARRSGREAGYKDGYATGAEEGRKAAHQEATNRFDEQHTNVVATMEQAIAGLDAIKNDLTRAAEKDLLDFSILIASKLTFAIGQLHRESATANLKRAMELVEAQTDLTVRVNPQDLKSVEAFAGSVLNKADASRAVTIVADESLAPGGCRIHDRRTDVDASLETQVEEMVALLLGGKAKDV